VRFFSRARHLRSREPRLAAPAGHIADRAGAPGAPEPDCRHPGL